VRRIGVAHRIYGTYRSEANASPLDATSRRVPVDRFHLGSGREGPMGNGSLILFVWLASGMRSGRGGVSTRLTFGSRTQGGCGNGGPVDVCGAVR
jgi:hypothetical protein